MTFRERRRDKILLVLSFLGLGVAALAGLADHIPWVASFCAGFSSGCQETRQFSLLHLPVWVWGIAYYVILSILLYRAKTFLYWWVATAFGVELSLMWIMLSINAICVFCVANAIIVAFTLVIAFEKYRFWQMLAVSSLAALISILVIPKENESIVFNTQSRANAIVATVKGKAITVQELEYPLALKLQDLEQEIYRQKKERLERMIEEMLLQEEADRHGLTIHELLKESIPSQAVEVSEQEIEDYYKENQAKLAHRQGIEKNLKERIRATLMKEKMSQKVVSYARSLASESEVVVYLKEPQLPNSTVSLGNDPVLGPSDAPVTIFQFSDYLCPSCRNVHEVTRKIRETYKDQIRWVFKDFPLKQHKWAKKAAEAARCAEEQGRFREYQDILYTSKEELTTDQLKRIAKDLGLQPEPFARCLDGGKYQVAVEKNLEAGRQAGVGTTPTFVINGKYYPGAPSFERFKEMIDVELKKVKERA